MPDGLIKINDAWINFKEAWVKRSGVWTKAQQIYQKQDGVYTLVQTPPQPPPQPPTITLQVDNQHRIHAGVRYPALVDQPSIKKIRVLVSRTAMPTSQFGTGEVKEAANAWKGEYWSTWAFNYAGQDYRPPVVSGSGPGDWDTVVNIATGEPDPNGTKVYRIHSDTSVVDTKIWPPNSDGDNVLPGGQWYYFAGWTQDMSDQWSVGTFTKVFVPSAPLVGGNLHKEANFQPNVSGYIDTSTLIGSPDGDLLTVGSSTQGVFYYGNKITNTVGENGPIADSVQGTIRLTRDNDTFAPSANVWMYWHDIDSGFVPSNHRFDKVKIGTIAKGETATFDIPSSWANTVWNGSIRGVGFGWSATPVTGDSSIIQGVGRNPRAGELNLLWDEVT